jgi:hypothetical protein
MCVTYMSFYEFLKFPTCNIITFSTIGAQEPWAPMNSPCKNIQQLILEKEPFSMCIEVYIYIINH